MLADVLAWIPEWERRSAYGGIDGVVNVGALRAGQPWRVSRTPDRADLFLDIRVPPTMAMNDGARRLRGAGARACASATPTPASPRRST